MKVLLFQRNASASLMITNIFWHVDTGIRVLNHSQLILVSYTFPMLYIERHILMVAVVLFLDLYMNIQIFFMKFIVDSYIILERNYY